MHIYIYAYLNECAIVSVKKHIYIYAYIYIYLYFDMHIHMCIYIYVSVFVSLNIYLQICIHKYRILNLHIERKLFQCAGNFCRKICLITTCFNLLYNLIGKGHGMTENEIFFMANDTENKKQQEVKPKPHHRQGKKCKPIHSHPSEFRSCEHFQ